MKITSIEFWPVTMKLKEPYTIAYDTFDSATNVFLKINTNSNITGFGCAAPAQEVTGETHEDVMRITRQFLEPVLLNADPFRISYYAENLKDQLKKYPSTLAMLDSALFDILAKKADLPLYKLLGGYRKSIKTSITIGILPLSETVEKAVGFVKDGFSVLKLKGGNNVDEDIERLIKTREAIGKSVKIRFDANQGYTVEDSIKFVNETKKVGIELLEQPTPYDELDKMAQVTSKVSIPVMADESLKSLRDVFNIAKRDQADMINIKIMKVGGIYEAMHINSVARSAGLEVMVGCMDEAALGIAAGLAFALSRPNVIYADLDGHLDLIGDPSEGAVILKRGMLFPSEKPGLGITL
ncbi:MAG: dipeptide epimerase [Bacteroidales bacterium]|nr:dipeptide epimerase [Bacteroidales bacterium]MCF8402635.1 dipeptide epimerase [Bacteroidales bacterium]